MNEDKKVKCEKRPNLKNSCQTHAKPVPNSCQTYAKPMPYLADCVDLD